MKSFVAVITLCFIAAAVDAQDEFTFGQVMVYKKECIAETGVDMDTLLKIKCGEQVEADDKVKCYAACILKKLGILKDDDTIDEDVIRSKVLKGLPEDKVDQVIKACSIQDGKDSCEIGGKILKCTLENHATLFLE